MRTSAQSTGLEVLTLHIASGDGAATTMQAVLCPEEHRVKALETCLTCDDSRGVSGGPGEGRATLICAGPVAAAGQAAADQGGARSALADRTPVSAIMTAHVFAVRPDVPLEAAAELLLEKDIGGAPVVDAEGHPVGVVSKTDLLRERWEDGETVETRPGRASRGEVFPDFHTVRLPTGTVADVMSRSPLTLSERASISEAAALMAFEGVHRVPVLAVDGRVIGVVTPLDVLRWMAQQDGYLRSAGRPADAS